MRTKKVNQLGRLGVALVVAGVASLTVPSAAQADVVHNDDVIANFSLCVGNDCANGENFGFDTLRLKENNLRIHFDDTSSSASFPNNDWRIVINDSSNGGANYFAVEDSTAGRQVFRVAAGAPANSLFVDSAGDVGVGTSNPVVELHVVDGDSPTLRLEQNGSSGFTPQTWDIAGNETNFFVRDVTNGSKLPFRIRPNAPTSSLDIGDSCDNASAVCIKNNGDVGMGTSSPDAPFDIEVGSGDADEIISLTRGGTTNPWLIRFQASDESFDIVTGTTVGQEFSLDTAGNLTLLGTITAPSSLSVKKNIERVDSAEVLAKVAAMPFLEWTYKHEDDVRHVGPGAEDFHAAFGLGNSNKHLSPFDTAGVALAAVQGLNTVIEEKEARLTQLEQQNAQLMDRLNALEQAVQTR